MKKDTFSIFRRIYEMKNIVLLIISIIILIPVFTMISLNQLIRPSLETVYSMPGGMLHIVLMIVIWILSNQIIRSNVLKRADTSSSKLKTNKQAFFIRGWLTGVVVIVISILLGSGITYIAILLSSYRRNFLYSSLYHFSINSSIVLISIFTLSLFAWLVTSNYVRHFTLTIFILFIPPFIQELLPPAIKVVAPSLYQKMYSTNIEYQSTLADIINTIYLPSYILNRFGMKINLWFPLLLTAILLLASFYIFNKKSSERSVN